MKKLWVSTVISCLLIGATLIWAVAWEETLPLNSEGVKLGASRIRAFKSAIGERFRVDHELPFAESTMADTTGYHKAIHLIDQTAPDTKAAGGIIYGNGGHVYIKSPLNVVTQIDTTVCPEFVKVYDSTVTNTCTAVTIDGLDGDSYSNYEVFAQIKTPGLGVVNLTLNGDTGSNYARIGPYNVGTSASTVVDSGVSTSLPLNKIISTAGGDHLLITSHIKITAKTGYQRNRAVFIDSSVFSDNNDAMQRYPCAGSWDDSTNNLTSITFTAGTNEIYAGSRFIVWRKQ